ncbi:MAG: hypothetical protein CMI53_03680 [Parcubacteria group bacterium]|nr:hypothetical protein [Parcubacteria group bacterium]|tara:strand:- start:4872 stop:5645 length:774 start_codon:yes stop_codon:yes gene_type:complete
MARTIAIVNQKGGVGKTTTAVNLGAYLALLGKFVLLADVDPQANSTSGMGVDVAKLEKGIYNTLVEPVLFREIVLGTGIQGYKIAPATQDLAGARVELVNLEDREYKLANALLEVKNDYDYILIDCPPSLDLLTLNGLVAADELIIPVQAEYLALEGLGQLLNTVNLVKENLKPELNILGAIVTMYDKRNKISADVLSELKQHFPSRLFDTIIPRNVRLTEAPSFGQTILSYDAASEGGRAYESLAREIIEQENYIY